MERANHPFQIFPIELWELNLEQIPDHQDIENVFRAIPEVENSSGSKKFSWLMERVMPLLASNYLPVDDLLNCRMVSKRWRNSVDISLETHPDRLPYNSARLGVIPGKIHICYNEVPLIKPNVQAVIQSSQQENIVQMPLGTNPFPGRYLHIPIKGYNVPNSPGVSWAEVVQLLERFGREIWYICFYCDHFSGGRESTLQHQTEFLTCLTLLPNLKSLELEGSFTGFASGTAFTQLNDFVMPASLEIIDFSGVIRQDTYFLRHLLPILVSHANIQKLGVFDTFWDNGLANLFPNLVELTVCIRMRNLVEIHLDKMLAAFASCPLRKLCVKSGVGLDGSAILRNIAPYDIEYLSLITTEIADGIILSSFRVPHLRHLEQKVAPGKYFSLLHHIPNLEYLTVKVDSKQAHPFNYPVIVNQTRTLDRCLQNYYQRQQFQPETFRDIWVDLRKLKMLTVQGAYDGGRRRYVREDVQPVFASSVHKQLGAQLPAQQLQELIHLLRELPTPDNQQRVIELLRSNQQLVAQFIRNREQEQEQQGLFQQLGQILERRPNRHEHQ